MDGRLHAIPMCVSGTDMKSSLRPTGGQSGRNHPKGALARFKPYARYNHDVRRVFKIRIPVAGSSQTTDELPARAVRLGKRLFAP